MIIIVHWVRDGGLRSLAAWRATLDVSIVCPVFNTSSADLEAAIQSVLTQAGRHNLELILVDDCSTDLATISALDAASTTDARVRVVHKAKNAGPGVARTDGIAQCRHEWIGFIDADDLWPSAKLDQADAVLLERPDSRWISGNYATLIPNGSLRSGPHLSTILQHCGEGGTAKRIETPMLTRGLIADWLPLGASLFRKDLLAEAGGFDPRLIYGEDWLLCLRLSTYAPMDYIETQTYVLRRQGMSMMRSPGRMSAKLAHSGRLARRDARLRLIRRELRWFQYRTFKDIAMNNALNGRKLRGLSYAFRALTVDPREVHDLFLFLRNLPVRGPALAKGLRGYSTAEQVILAQLAPGRLPQARDG